jgi:hypothetical protein
MNNQFAQLSKRWVHEEAPSENPVRMADKLSHGDISSWAHATSKPFGSPFKPRRPEVGRARNAFTPIRSLNSIHPVISKPEKHDPNSVVLHSYKDHKPDPCDINKTFSIQKSFWKLLGHRNMDVRPKA